MAPALVRSYNPPIYERDEAKRQTNLACHGVDFAEAASFEWAVAMTMTDRRRDYGEERFISISFMGERLHVLVWTQRGETKRLISLRKANQREVRRYVDRT
jgi:uncharacterized DUF497 family protein